MEGWLHFHGSGVQEKEIGATVYRLTVLTPEGGDSTDVAGAKNLGALEGRQFQKIPYASRAFKDEQQDSGCAFHGFFDCSKSTQCLRVTEGVDLLVILGPPARETL